MQDLRAKIAAVLECVGFDFAAESLAANERAALLMAQCVGTDATHTTGR